jgi:hypothetical protein
MRRLNDDELAFLAARTLAETAFLIAEPPPESDRFEQDWTCAVVRFDATVCGRLVVAAPLALAAQVAAEMSLVAAAEDATPLHAGSAVADLASAIADTVVAEIFAACGIFRLGQPAIVDREPPLAPGERAHRITLVNEVGQPVRVELVLGESS